MTTATATHDAGIEAPSAEHCAGCGAPNNCAVVRGATVEACWCWQQPRAGLKSAAGSGADLGADAKPSGASASTPTLSAAENLRCYCARCLSQRLASVFLVSKPEPDNEEPLP